MSRHFRQAKILEIIEKYPIDTQEELAEHLKTSGFKITQATVCRDIKDLGLIKAPYGDKQRYCRDVDRSIMLNKFKDIFRTSIVTFEQVGNIIVLKTLNAMASAASIMIEHLNFEGVAGTIAGSDTVFVLLKTVDCGQGLIRVIEQIINN